MDPRKERRLCRWTILLAGLAALGVARADGAAGGFVAVASDYLYHGLSQSQGNSAALIDGHYRSDANLFAGVTLATVKLNPGPSAPLEVGVYGGASRDLSDDWVARATLARYFYPGNPADLSYAYTELSASLEWRELLSGTLYVSPDTSRYATQGVNRQRPAQALEIEARWPLGAHCTFSTGVGYRHLAAPIDAGYGYGSAGIAMTLARWRLDLSAVAADHHARVLFGGQAAERRLVVSALRSFGGPASR